MKKILACLSLILASACVTGSNDTKNTLESAGFTNVEVQGTAIFGCGEHDYMGRKFKARNSQGRVVTGIVCCGLLKGCTVRF